MSYLAIRSLYTAFFVALVLGYVSVALVLPTYYMVQTRAAAIESVIKLRLVNIYAVCSAGTTYLKVKNNDVYTVYLSEVGMVGGATAKKGVGIELQPGQSYGTTIMTGSCPDAAYAKVGDDVVATSVLSVTPYTTYNIDITSVLPTYRIIDLPFITAPTGEPVTTQVASLTRLVVGGVYSYSNYTALSDYVACEEDVTEDLYMYGHVSTSCDWISVTGNVSKGDASFTTSLTLPGYADEFVVVVALVREVMPPRYFSVTATPTIVSEAVNSSTADLKVTYLEAIYPGVIDADSIFQLVTHERLVTQTDTRGAIVSVVQAKVYRVKLKEPSAYTCTGGPDLCFPGYITVGNYQVPFQLSIPSDMLVTRRVGTYVSVTLKILPDEILKDLSG